MRTGGSHQSAALTLVGLLVLLLTACAGGQQPTPTPTPTSPATPSLTPAPGAPFTSVAGKTYFWFGVWPDTLCQYDPEVDQVVRRIKLRHGLPWHIELTHDKQRFLVVTNQQKTIEVIDRHKGEVVDEHDFSENGYIVRIRNIVEVPGGTQWYVATERIKKELDRYVFEANQVLLYDIANKKVEKKLKRMPEALSRGAQISPDGLSWHTFTEDGDLAVLDPKTLKETAKIDLHTPRFGGAGGLSVQQGEDLFRGENKDAYRLVFSSSDPVQKGRTSWGLVDIDLRQNKVGRVLEWGLNPGTFGMQYAAKKPVAAAMAGGFGGGSPFGDDRSPDRRMRLQLYDLETGKKVKEAIEEFRPRRWLVAISPAGDKVYVGVAGSDFEIFDAELKRIKQVELGGEVYGQIFVVDG